VFKSKEVRDHDRQTKRDVKEFHKTGKATPKAKVALQQKAMNAIWDIADGRGRSR
jgi:hypothetical protein